MMLLFVMFSRMRWEDDQVRMTSLETSEDTRALKTRCVHGSGCVPRPSPLAKTLMRNFKAQRRGTLFGAEHTPDEYDLNKDWPASMVVDRCCCATWRWICSTVSSFLLFVCVSHFSVHVFVCSVRDTTAQVFDSKQHVVKRFKLSFLDDKFDLSNAI